jgi:ubiquinone/menaquinone biosynthesis C-methylase UbiE
MRDDSPMAVPPELFDEDYLYFYDEVLGAQSDADAEAVSRLLELEPGMRVLDVPCGEGRIGGRLAARGREVVGVDVTERFLELGRERHPGVRFVRGDMRELAYEEEFDAVVNWFTSWGYFDSSTNDAVLGAFARALRPGGG